MVPTTTYTPTTTLRLALKPFFAPTLTTRRFSLRLNNETHRHRQRTYQHPKPVRGVDRLVPLGCPGSLRLVCRAHSLRSPQGPREPHAGAWRFQLLFDFVVGTLGGWLVCQVGLEWAPVGAAVMHELDRHVFSSLCVFFTINPIRPSSHYGNTCPCCVCIPVQFEVWLLCFGRL